MGKKFVPRLSRHRLYDFDSIRSRDRSVIMPKVEQQIDSSFLYKIGSSSSRSTSYRLFFTYIISSRVSIDQKSAILQTKRYKTQDYHRPELGNRCYE